MMRRTFACITRSVVQYAKPCLGSSSVFLALLTHAIFFLRRHRIPNLNRSGQNCAEVDGTDPDTVGDGVCDEGMYSVLSPKREVVWIFVSVCRAVA